MLVQKRRDAYAHRHVHQKHRSQVNRLISRSENDYIAL